MQQSTQRRAAIHSVGLPLNLLMRHVRSPMPSLREVLSTELQFESWFD
jgi:hypothetical protein